MSWRSFQKKARAWCEDMLAKLSNVEDLDTLFSYRTPQYVEILDRKLGIAAQSINILILLYIVIYMFYLKRGYLEFEQAKGAIATIVSGDIIAVSSGKPATRYFSSEELTYPGLENGNVFVATRLTVHHQERGICEDHAVPCVVDTDCTPMGGGTCTENNYCREKSWCDSEPLPEIYELDTGLQQIWVKSSIQFVKLAPERVFTTSDVSEPRQYPKTGFNTFTVRDLLLMCEPLPVRFEEVSELGAAIEVQFMWECNVNNLASCTPDVHVRRLDTIFDPDNIGFTFKHTEMIDEDHRVKNEVRGVRIFFRTVGVGNKFSFTAAMTKFSTALVLFGAGKVITDQLLQRAFANSKRYVARKIEKSPNFEEYLDELSEKQSRVKTTEKLDADEKRYQEKEKKWQKKLDEEDDY